MERRQIAAPAVEDRGRRRKVVLKQPCASVRPGKEPVQLVVAGPGGCGKEGRHAGAGGRPGENAVEKIPAWTEEGHQCALVNLPGIVARAAIESRLSERSGAPRPGKKS